MPWHMDALAEPKLADKLFKTISQRTFAENDEVQVRAGGYAGERPYERGVVLLLDQPSDRDNERVSSGLETQVVQRSLRERPQLRHINGVGDTVQSTARD